MSRRYNVLVTGCGGDIGQSVGKILKSSPMFQSVIGCDMNEDHAGKFIFDTCVQIARCSSDAYMPRLKSIIDQFQIDIIVPVSEPELRFFAEKHISDELLGRPLICANLKSMQVGFDKYRTAVFLEENGLPFPETHLVSEMNAPEFPLIMKSRNGSGSKSLFKINDIEDFNFYKRKHPDFIIQEFLENDHEEYTCGVFRDEAKQTRMLIFRRKLMGGFSGFGTVVENSIIEKLLFEIARSLDLRGAINVQLRLINKVPLVFEINPRFSSTVMFRHMMGFEDVIWSIQDRLGFPVSKYTPPPKNKNFYKGFHEYID